jgi:hypothetical protein
MFMHSIKLMGPEYVLMLGVWWGAAVILTVLAMVIRRAVERWNEHRHAGRPARTAAGGRLDG